MYCVDVSVVKSRTRGVFLTFRPDDRCLRSRSVDGMAEDAVFKKNLNAPKLSNQSKGLGGNIGCRDPSSTWY